MSDNTTGAQTSLRSHTCGALRLGDVGAEVKLAGWVMRTRDFGKFLFLDLRDRHGITQLSIRAEEGATLYEEAKRLGREYVIAISGKVVARENANPKLETGQIEVVPHSLRILNAALVPPFLVEDETDGAEDLRLEYRYLDLRRPVINQALVLRAKMVRAIRNYLDNVGFLEIETPNLIKSTPEGARDFIVPSRLHPGSFYALPQSPQLLKQLLMVGGMDRYYQICKCFRDEDFRGDRQPEFTQVDCEMSFVNQEDVLNTFEGLTKEVFRAVKGVELPAFQRLPYREAIEKYGTDKPDLRFGMPIVALNTLAQGSTFPPFVEALQSGGLVAGLNAQGAAGYTRKELDSLTEFVKAPHRGMKGLVYLRLEADGSMKSSMDKFYDAESLKAFAEVFKAEPGDLILICAGAADKVRRSLGDLRLEMGTRLGLRKEVEWSVFWVVDFPMFEAGEAGEIVPVHHPFVAPNPEDVHLLDTNPTEVRAYCYDLVMNGNEILSGSIRIHERAVQNKIFELLGLSEAERQEKFGFLLRAFEYGAPPHGGCAFGLDRWAMLFAGGESIRDVIAFPKNSSGRDVMLDAPAAVPASALKDVGIRLSE